jgi:hypothetical protein
MRLEYKKEKNKGKQWGVEMSEECPLFGTFRHLKKGGRNGKGNA